MLEMTLIKVKVTIEGHKGQILGQNSDFQHMAFWELWSLKLKVTVNRKECLPEHFDAKVLHND